MALDLGWAGGHYWTLADHIVDRARPPVLQPHVPWQTEIEDPHASGVKIEVTGWLEPREPHEQILVIVHGLGGSADSGYVRRLAQAASAAGFATLRLHLRGADRRGQGFYHAGLASDLLAALASPEVSRYRRRYVVGFSMGGHVSLRALATHPEAAHGLVSVCAPLDLAESCRHIDHPLRSLYRWHVLSGLKEMYGVYAQQRGIPVDPRIARCQRLFDWDEHVVAPHFGFAGAADYYQRMSVAPLLPNMECRTLVIATPRDPMVPEHVLRPYLRNISPSVSVSWLDGGHVGFPPRVAIWSRILRWLQT